MSDPNAPPPPDDALPPEYADTPPKDPNDVIEQAREALAPGGAVDQTVAAQANLAADEAAVEADPKVKIALAIDKVRALLDEVAPAFALVPDPLRATLLSVKGGVDIADDLLAKIGL